MHIELNAGYVVILKLALKISLALTSKDKSFDENRHIFSGIIRHYSNVKANLSYEFNLKSEKAYLDSPLIPDERIDNVDRILQYISDNEEYAGHELTIDANYDYPIAFAKNKEEMSYFLKTLLNDLRWIDNPRSSRYVLNQKGREQLVRIKRGKKKQIRYLWLCRLVKTKKKWIKFGRMVILLQSQSVVINHLE